MIPDLLKYLSIPKSVLKHVSIPETETVSKDTHIRKPDLAPLFDLSREEAKMEFERSYLHYHIQKNQDNHLEAARSMGMTKKLLQQNLRRLKEKQKIFSSK